MLGHRDLAKTKWFIFPAKRPSQEGLIFNQKFEMKNFRFEMRNRKFEMRNRKFEMRNIGIEILDLRSGIEI
jgi:hypothetical protein